MNKLNESAIAGIVAKVVTAALVRYDEIKTTVSDDHVLLASDNVLRAMFAATAEHLTGKVIILRFTVPPAMNALGESYIDENGITRINIAPGVSVQEAYNILLHEAAHIRLDHPGKVTKAEMMLEPFVDVRQVNSQPERKQKENEAERLANQWREYAHAQIKKSLRLGTPEKDRAFMNLNALLSCKWIGAK
mgnify:CR=1 FL=1